MSGLCGVWYLADSKHWRKYLDEYQKVIGKLCDNYIQNNSKEQRKKNITKIGIDLLHKKKSNVRSDRICEILNKGDEWIIKTPSSLRSSNSLKIIYS